MRPVRFQAACLLFVFIVVLAGCTPPLYLSGGSQTVFHEKKGDLQFGGHLGRGGGAGVAGAVAVTDHIGVLANASATSLRPLRRGVEPRSGTYTENAVGEIGVGAYGTHGDAVRFRYALYAGYGAGRARSVDRNNSFFESGTGVRIEGTYQRVFIQPSIALVMTYFELSFTHRIVFVDFDTVEVARPLGSAPVHYEAPANVFLEPTFAVGVGPRTLRAVMQVGIQHPLGGAWQDDATSRAVDAPGRPPLLYAPGLFSLGVQVRLQDV